MIHAQHGHGGVYMVARAHSLYEMAPEVLTVPATIGTITAIVAASIALVRRHQERVGTRRHQLGYMSSSGMVLRDSVLHLRTHAFLTAALLARVRDPRASAIRAGPRKMED